MTTRGEAIPRAPAPGRMATGEQERFVLVWHGTESPSQAEWDAAVRVVGQHASRPLRVMVFTDGGGPSISQQQQLLQALSGKSPLVAVLSDHVGVRFVASSLALFMKRIRTFRADEISLACEHLGLDGAERKAAALFVEQHRGKKL